MKSKKSPISCNYIISLRSYQLHVLFKSQGRKAITGSAKQKLFLFKNKNGLVNDTVDFE